MKNTPQAIIEKARIGMIFWRGHYGHCLEKRDEIAREIFANPARRKVEVVPGLTVETWFDRLSRNWVTYVLDANGCQKGDAEYAGNKETAAFNHMRMICDVANGEIK